VQTEDLDKLKEQLAGGHPVIFGMDVSDDFSRLKSGVYNDLSAVGTEGRWVDAASGVFETGEE
jgi:hypothetical protein